MTRPASLSERTQGAFTIAGPGPEDRPRIYENYEPFVHPGYADLNPSYEHHTSSKPVWSLAKPLPRVVRPGMVPTKEELLQGLQKSQQPAEHSQKAGLNVDLSELERGHFKKSADPRKIAAQVEDARLQRESNLVNKLLKGEIRSADSSLALTDRIGRSPIRDLPIEGGVQSRGRRLPLMSDDGLASIPNERDPLLGEDTYTHVDEGAYPDDLHPLVQDSDEDEVHNNHTTWSVIRTQHREALGEFLAVFVQLTVGFSADLAVTLANAGNPNTTAWAWGLATMMAVHVAGGTSGAHLNPAISIIFWFYRGFPQRKLPGYFTAQFTGAFCAAIVAYGVYYPSIQSYLSTNPDKSIVNSFVTNPQTPWITPTTAFSNEFLGTAILTITILALGDDQNTPPGPGMNTLIIGLVITCMGLTFSYQTGAALNPSRDFGPRLALLALGYSKDLFQASYYWFYGPWVGALLGGLMGAFLYDFMIFTGGESPVNYPLERTQRAMRKSGKEWKRKLRIR